MGLDRTIACPQLPPWPNVAQRLAAEGLAVQIRMIDGQLAFPDEEPPAEWRELRVSVADGMVTLRREGNEVRLVTWGNADAKLLAARDRLAEVLLAM